MSAWLSGDYASSMVSPLPTVSRLTLVSPSTMSPASTLLSLSVVSTSSVPAPRPSPRPDATTDAASSLAAGASSALLALSSLAASASLPMYSYGAMATATAADQNASAAGYKILGVVCAAVLVLAVCVGLGLFARAHPQTLVGRGILRLARTLCGCCCCYDRARSRDNKPKRLEDGLAPAATLMTAASTGAAAATLAPHRSVPAPPAHHHRLGHRRTVSEEARERELAEARVQVQRAQAPLPKRQQTINARGLTIQPAKPSMNRRPSQRPDLDDVTEASEPPTAGTRLVESPEPIAGGGRTSLSMLPAIEERRAF